MSAYLELFSKYLLRADGGQGGGGEDPPVLDAEHVLSPECFEDFCRIASEMHERYPELLIIKPTPFDFARTLSLHVCATSPHHIPFKRDEEAALLVALRASPTPWARCFPADCELPPPFMAKGYHERLIETKCEVSSHEQFDLQQPDDTKLIVDLALRIVELCKGDGGTPPPSSAPSEFTSEKWQAALDVIRFVILARTKAVCCPYAADWPGKLCEEASLANPGAAVLVVDFRKRDFHRRIAASNGMSSDMLGCAATAAPTMATMMIDGKDVFRVVLAILNSFFRPGAAFPLCQRLPNARNATKQYNVVYLVDPASFLLAMVIRPHGL